MTTHAVRHAHATPTLPLWLAVAFICGAISVLLFHQGAAALLHALQLTPRAPYSMNATAPFGVPQLWSIAFWGGARGVSSSPQRWPGCSSAALVFAATLFGAILPTLVAWFVVAPLKGQPMAAGFVPAAMLIGPIVNAAWGLGTGLGTCAVAESTRQSALLTVSAGFSGRRRKNPACPASGCASPSPPRAAGRRPG